MATMQVTGFDGTLFSSLSLTTVPVLDIFGLEYSGTYVQTTGGMPQFAGVNYSTIPIPCKVEFGGQADVLASIRAFQQVLRLDLGTERVLTGILNDGTAIEILCRPKSFQWIGPGYLWLVVWEASNYWKASTATSVTVTGPTIAAGDVTRAITAGGTVRALPTVTLTPQLPKTSGPVIFTMSSSVTEQDGLDLLNVPYTITWDHAAAVTAIRSLAAGTDIQITVDGTQVVRSVTGANTSSCRVTFPLTVAANATATVIISYAATGQTYGLSTYAQAGETWAVVEQSGNTLVDYPYMVEFDHASYVTAGYSIASGADIRAWVDGVEVSRAINGANTSTCDVWLPVPVTASGTAIVAITMAASGYSYAGSAYSNGSLDLTASSNTTWVYTTPGYAAGDDTPGKIKPIQARISTTYAGPTSTNSTVGGTDPTIKNVYLSGSDGNYFRFYAGGVRLYSASFTLTYRSGTTGVTTVSRLGETTDLSTWSSAHDFTAYASTHVEAYATYAFSTGVIAAMIGSERASSGSLSSNDNVAVGGTGSSELQVALVSADVPANSTITNPSITTSTALVSYAFAGSLTDELGHSIAVSNITAPTTWAANTGTLIDSNLSNWTLTGATLATGVTDPAGGTAAYTIIEDSANSQHLETITGITVVDGDVVTLRVTGHANGRTVIGLNVPDNPYSGNCYVQFDLSAGTISTAAGTAGAAVFSNVSASIEPGGAAGWFAGSLTFTPTGITSINVQVELINGSDTYIGDGTSGIDVYDVQLVSGTGAAGSLVIDAATKTAWLLDRGGTEVANSALVARKGLRASGNDGDWLALAPNATTTITWTESYMDADGMMLNVEARDRWR